MYSPESYEERDTERQKRQSTIEKKRFASGV